MSNKETGSRAIYEAWRAQVVAINADPGMVDVLPPWEGLSSHTRLRWDMAQITLEWAVKATVDERRSTIEKLKGRG